MEESEIINQIKEKRKIPEEIKNTIMNKIAENAISVIIVYVYFIFLALGARNIHKDIYVTDLRVFSVSFAVLAVVFLEKGYGNRNNKKICTGIEILVVAIVTMFLQYCTLYLSSKYRIIIPIFAILYNIYFFLKTLIITRKIKSEYKRNSNDIKEIIKHKGN